MIKVGIVGVGHLGEIHLKLISNSKLFTLTGFYDNNRETAALISEKYNAISYSSHDDLCNDIDAVIICTPTLHHFETAKFFLSQNKHVFIEKPITTNLVFISNFLSHGIPYFLVL